MTAFKNLDPIFNPKSIAVIGASRDVRKGGGMFLAALRISDYEGKVFPVNPREKEIDSLPCYPSVGDIQESVDLAILTVANRLVPGLLQECAAKGIKNVVIHSAGFAEVEDTGKSYDREITSIAQEFDINLVGPNCMGVCNAEIGLNTIVFNKKLKKEKGVFSFVGQSGWGAENVLLMCNERGLRSSKIVSSGNQTNLDVIDYIEYFAQDEDTRVIGAYIEELQRADQFVARVGAIAERKPVIVMKGGKTQAGNRAALSHTASLGGSSAVFEGAVRQTGVIGVNYLEEIIDTAVAFSAPIYPAGRRVGLVMEAGGAAVTAADFCEQLGLEVPRLTDAARAKIEELVAGHLPPGSGLGNPVDLVWPPDHLRLEIVKGIMGIMAPEVDSFLFVTYHPLDDPALTEQSAAIAEELQKPIFVLPGHHTENRQHMPALIQAGVPTFVTPYRACRALASLVRFSVGRDGAGRGANGRQ